MKGIKMAVVVGAMATLGLVFAVRPAVSKPEFAKSTGKPCAMCHVKAGSKDLNDVGKCYKDKKDLAACEKK